MQNLSVDYFVTHITRVMARRKSKKRGKGEIAPTRSGGLAYFMSFAFLLLICGMNVYLLPLLWDTTARSNVMKFFAGVIVGGWFAGSFIRGKHSILVHELKHAIVSGLAGNRWKKLKIKRQSGYFQYSYTKKTRDYNAFIALAPYWLPFFTIPALLIGIPLWYGNHTAIAVIAGIGYGADLIMNLRDISPRQTDLTLITGGYGLTLLYLFTINLAVVTLLLAWIMQELFGLKFLLYGMWQFVVHLVTYYRGI